MSNRPANQPDDPEPRVLIVDDDAEFAESLADVLESHGYGVAMAHSAEQAGSIIEDFDASVALVDIRLGTNDGLDLLADLKQARPGICCVTMSAYADLESAIRAVREGAREYLQKPIDGEELLATVKRCCEMVRLRREKVAAERALQRSEANYREIFDAGNDAIIVNDMTTGNILDVNHEMCQMFGYTCEEARQLDIGDLGAGHPPYMQQDAARWIARAAMGEPQFFEWLARDRQGRKFWVEVGLKRATITGKDCILAVVRDITDRKRAEQKLHDTLAELSQSNEELEAYGYTISHDLKSPLITIAGLLGWLREHAEKGDLEKMNEDMVRISSAANKMKLLLDQLLELSRVGHVAGPPEAVSLENLAREAVELASGSIGQRAVRVDIAPGLPVVRGDRARLLQVFMNLIGNAVKFIGEQAEPRIEIGVRQDGDATVCYVRDNGAGIEPQHKDRIFGLFQQLNPRAGGTGIGLTLVKRIVEAHGGRVWAESEGLGKGSTFCFTAPGLRERTRQEQRNERQSDGCLVG